MDGLTDGQETVGISGSKQIIRAAKKNTQGRHKAAMLEKCLLFFDPAGFGG